MASLMRFLIASVLLAPLSVVLLLAPLGALAASNVALDHAPVNVADKDSLRRGAHTFLNYCLGCHSASHMRYNRLMDIGLSKEQIEQNLLFTGEKVGDLMNIPMQVKDAKEWFGVAPPDLSVIARARGADWLYTYLRKFYVDDSRPIGWNNVVFPNVGMPHALFALQGKQVMEVKKIKDAHGHESETHTLKLANPGSLTPVEYDRLVGDLVNYLVWMGEPAQLQRFQTGVKTMFFLVLLFALAYGLKLAYWKDIH